MCDRPVLVLGSTCVDVIIRVDHLPHTEENLHPQSQRFAIGGCAYNAANILGRAGGNVVFVSPVGLRGVYGPFALAHLEKLPFAAPVVLPQEENGCCYCLVEKGGERTFLSIHGAEYTFDPAWMERFSETAFAYAYVCGLEIEEKTGERLVTWLESAPCGTVFYAPGPRGMKVDAALTERLLRLRPILHVNEREARLLSGRESVEDAMRVLHARTGNMVIVTLGAQGAACIEENEITYVPGVPVRHVADTIGAGDAHAGAVLLGLSRGMALRETLSMANRVSAAVVCTDGATLTDEALRKALER